MNQKSNMIIYTTEDGLTKIETTFDEDTVWLSIDQMAELFQRDKSTISRHIKNVLRKAVGDEIIICDNTDEKDYLCRIDAIEKEIINCKYLFFVLFINSSSSS